MPLLRRMPSQVRGGRVSPCVGTCLGPDGLVHVWYLQTLGSFEADLVLCDRTATPGLGGWTYLVGRVTCERCKGSWGEPT